MNVRRLTRIAILAAMAYLLILIEIPLPGFPPFLKYDLSEVPALMAAFTMGPVAGVLVELIKDVLKTLINPGSGGFWGMAANLLAGGTLVYMAGLTRKLLGGIGRSVVRDVIALVTGTATMTLVMLLANGYVFFPIWFHLPQEQVWPMAVAISTPFNLVKGLLSTVAAVLLYRPLHNVLTASKMGQPSMR